MINTFLACVQRIPHYLCSLCVCPSCALELLLHSCVITFMCISVSMGIFRNLGARKPRATFRLLLLPAPPWRHSMGGGKAGRGRHVRAPNLRVARGKGKGKGKGQPDPERGSLLAAFLLEQWSWGFMSAQMVQAIAERSRLDFDRWTASGQDAVAQDLRNLAELGSRGAHHNNCNRDLLALLGHEGNHVPDPLAFTTLCKTARPGIFASRPMQLLLPHEFFASLYHHYPAHWRTHVCPSDEDLEAFWIGVDSHPALCNNPIRDDPEWRRRAIPLSLHGDGVPIKGV